MPDTNVVVLDALTVCDNDIGVCWKIQATYDLSQLPVKYHVLATQSIVQSQETIKVCDRLSDEEERNLELGYIGRLFRWVFGGE